MIKPVTNLFATLLCIAALFSSCGKVATDHGSESPSGGGNEEDPAIVLEKSDIAVPADGGTYTVSFTSNRDWTASVSDDSWVHLTETSGKASASAATIHFLVDENPDQSERSSVITLRAESIKKTVSVNQQGCAPPPTQDYFILKNLSGKETDLVLMSREGGRQELMVSTSLKPAEWSLEGGNETWCKVYWDGSLIRMEVDPYGEQYEYLYPRSCKVSIKSSKLSDVSFTLAQESDTELHTLYYRNQFQLPPSGTPLDIFIFTNFYQWKVKSDSDWFTAEQPDRMTLRVRATPKQEGDTQIRNGSVTLYSAAWAEEDLEYIYWSQIVKLYFSDGDPDLSGEDYEYGDKQDWD